MREVAALGVLTHKSGSKERGQIWQQVAENLNQNDEFYVANRAVRDRLSTIMKKYRVLINKDKKLSGEGGEEATEYDVLIEELIELSDDTDARCEEKAKEKEKAMTIEKRH